MKDPKGPVKPYKSPEELAKKHKVSLETIMKQVKIGTKIEGEHTTSKSGARITALQHVDEFPDYYTRLKKVEKNKPMKEETTAEKQYKEDIKYCLLCRKNETRAECSWGPSMWDKYTIGKMNLANELKIHEGHKEIASGKKKDEEGYMARVEFDQIERAVNILRGKIKKGDQQIPAWVQSKITRAADFIDTAAEYMQSDEDVSEGMTYSNFITEARKKVKISTTKPIEFKIADIGPGGKEHNVKTSKGWKDIKEASPAWQRKEGKNPTGGLNAKGRASARAQGHNLKPPVTTPPSKLKPGSKAANRRKSFCARMGGMPGPMKDEKGRPTRKALSLRKWNC